MRTRKCSICGQDKPLEDFPRNRSRKHGRAYQCLCCHRAAQREARRKARLPGKEQSQVIRPMMGNELFAVYFQHIELRQHIRDSARELASKAHRDTEYARDLEQIGWMHVGMCLPHQAIEHYMTVAFNAMERDRWKERQKREYALDDIEAMSSAEYNMWRKGVY